MGTELESVSAWKPPAANPAAEVSVEKVSPENKGCAGGGGRVDGVGEDEETEASVKTGDAKPTRRVSTSATEERSEAQVAAASRCVSQCVRSS